MASSGNISKVKLNGSEYDIKDTQARSSIDSIVEELAKKAVDSELHKVAKSGNYADLEGKPTIGSGVLTVKKNNTSVGTFSANATANASINIEVPTKTSDLTNDGNGTATDKFLTSSEVDNKIAAAQTGAAMFKGTISQGIAFPPLATGGDTAWKRGDYWLVSEAGTYLGFDCEAGDMIFAIKDDTGADVNTINASQYFTVIQANITQTQLNQYAKKAGETYSGKHNFESGTITVPTQTAGTANTTAASTQFVKTAIDNLNTTLSSTISADKIQDFSYLNASVNLAKGTTTIDNLYSNIQSAYASKKLPIVILLLGTYTMSVPILMLKKGTDSSAAYEGSATHGVTLSENGVTETVNIGVTINASSISTNVTITRGTSVGYTATETLVINN